VTVLGAILAGGRSSRFGSDKAVATLHGERLIDVARAALAGQCDAVAVIGRDGGVPDWPAPSLGPLGGVAGALRHAEAEGHHLVLTCGVDSVGLPGDLVERLSLAPAYVLGQPVIGLWPVEALAALEARLAGPGSHSMRAFADGIGARGVDLHLPLANVNTRADLARLEQQDGL
jgi:molybdopterin-guanine dinucleotide biosynthesis protein A